MLILARVSQERLVEVATACGACGITTGTSASGWTALLADDDDALLPGRLADVDRLVVDDDTEESTRLRVLPAQATMLASGGPEVSWVNGNMRPGSDPEGTAQVLARWFRVRPEEVSLTDNLRASRLFDSIDVADWLSESLELPDIDIDMPIAVAVGSPGDPDDQPATAVPRAALFGYTPEGWRVLRNWNLRPPSTPDLGTSMKLAQELSTGRPGSFALLLYREGDGAGAGVQIWQAGELGGQRSWHPTERLVPPREAGADEFDGLLRDLLGDPVDEERFAALRADWLPHVDPLVEFVDVLDLPERLLQALDDPESFSRRDDVVLIGRRSRWQVARAALEERAGAPPETSMQRVMAVGKAFMVALGFLLFGVVAVQTAVSAVSTGSFGSILLAVVLSACVLVGIPVLQVEFGRAFASPDRRP